MDMHCHSLAMLNWNGDCFVLAGGCGPKRIFNGHSKHCTHFQWNWRAEGRGKAAAPYRQDVLHGDHEDVVGNQPVPVTQDAPNGLQQQVSTKEKEIEAGHQVAHTEYADPCGSRDEDYGKHKPEEVTKYYHLIHVQVGSRSKIRRKSYIFFFSEGNIIFPLSALLADTCAQGLLGILTLQYLHRCSPLTPVRGFGSCMGLPSSYIPLQLLPVRKHLATPGQSTMLAARSSLVSWKGGKPVLTKILGREILSGNVIYVILRLSEIIFQEVWEIV